MTKQPLPEALAYAEKGFSLAPWTLPNVGLLAGLLVRNGDQARADDLLRILGDGHAHGAPCALAIFHFICSEIEAGAEWMEKALAQKNQMAAMLLLTPPYGPLVRSSSRWPALAKMMNLPETG